jgi:antibiotic biosynthesis monooxygenase (ABM) superfamily enzyme
MPTITLNRGIVTQINLFDAPPENHDALIALLKEAATSVSDIPGWMSARLHREMNGRRIVNYAQCDSMASWEAVMRRLREGGFLERNKTLATAHPGLYEVVATLTK